LKDDTILVRIWRRGRRRTLCRDGEAVAACEARARAKLLQEGSPERVVYSCANEPGGYCLVVRHNDEVSTLRGKGTSWEAIADGLWSRWGSDEVDVIIMSVGEERKATVLALSEDASPLPMIFLRRSSREQARGEIKAAAPGFSALNISMRGGDDSTRWFPVSASCKPKDEPHPSTHEGPWYCFAGPPSLNELTAGECFTTEAKCADARDDLAGELRMRRAAHGEISQCSASAKVSCFEMSSSYSTVGGWRSFRSYYCYPSPQRCEEVRPESPLLHAMVRSACFEASR
jgi:hypothetical protein